MLTLLSKKLFYPFWDIKDKSIRLKTLDELECTQWLSAEELQNRQWKSLKHILRYAYGNCAHYRVIFDFNRINPEDIASPQDILKIPVLTKKQIQENTDNLISKLYSKESLLSAKTGGSTGKSLKIYFDKQCQEIRNAAAIHSDRWTGWDLGIRIAAIWGNPPAFDTFKKKMRKATFKEQVQRLS